MLIPARAGEPRILSPFRDWLGADGYPRVNWDHLGVALAGRIGTEVWRG
jgi:hypothetical protein